MARYIPPQQDNIVTRIAYPQPFPLKGKRNCLRIIKTAIDLQNTVAVCRLRYYHRPSGSNLTSESRLGLPLDLPNIVVSLQAAISCFIARLMMTLIPSPGSQNPNKSIVAVRRGYQVLDSIH